MTLSAPFPRDPHGGSPTRWELLFGDLEAQAAAQDVAEADALVSELTRAEHATITVADRFRAGIGVAVVVDLLDGEPVRGTVREAADEWVLLQGAAPAGPAQHLVPLRAVTGVSGLGRHAAPGSRRDGAGLGPVLRALQRGRSFVLVRTLGGRVAGRIGRVGRDHLDVDDLTRPGGARLVPFGALLCVSEVS
ncbi:hypothetical protein [Antribacter gilvus]|uniref:hypothetical protein n=1 Tax=Antribacter gilvus TaxID=2304675 RepID=UPI000F7B4527|nr:hypothetical protein [Antribacter gilvus]